MRKFTVNTDRLIGLGGILYVKGKEIRADQLAPGHADILLRRGKITNSVDYSIKQGEKIRLAIVTSVWKRPEVVKMFVNGIFNLMEKCTDFDITLIVSKSEQNDAEFPRDVFSRIPNEKLILIEIPNEPLATKVNATTYACKNRNFHYVLCVGSDDIMSPELLNEYAVHMKNGIDFIGVTDCYFYDTISGKSLYWGGYREAFRKGFTCGAFRAISVNLLSKWDFMPWENKDSHGLDHSMQQKLRETPHSSHTFSLKEKGLFALDIKSSTNMTPFKQWDNSEFIDSQIIKKQFPYVWD